MDTEIGCGFQTHPDNMEAESSIIFVMCLLTQSSIDNSSLLMYSFTFYLLGYLTGLVTVLSPHVHGSNSRGTGSSHYLCVHMCMCVCMLLTIWAACLG